MDINVLLAGSGPRMSKKMGENVVKILVGGWCQIEVVRRVAHVNDSGNARVLYKQTGCVRISLSFETCKRV